VSALQAFDEPVSDAVPLTSWERVRKDELEQTVASGLAEFLRVGAALAELRNRRLYRTQYATFEQYVRAKFGLARSSVDQVIRTAATAQALLDNCEELAPGTTEAVIRPISVLPTLELRAACWSLAKSVAPARGPSQPLVSKLCRMVRNCLEDTGAENGHDGDPPLRRDGRHRSLAPLERETPFVRPITRLENWSGFSAEMIISHIAEASNAKSLYSACSVMIGRLSQVQERLINRFPEVEDSSLVEHNQR
jgi:hypothetical protein